MISFIRTRKLVNRLLLLILFNGIGILSYGQPTKINYVDKFPNANHPEIAYWFISKDMLVGTRFEEKLDSLAKYSNYTLIFLTARNGVDFYDLNKMHPYFEKWVNYAHSKGLQIGLQLWEKRYDVPLKNTERIVQVSEAQLDDQGKAVVSVKAKHARIMSSILKSEVFRIYAFRKTTDGNYKAGTLKEITSRCTSTADKENVKVAVQAGKEMKGYTISVLTQHYYNFCSNFSREAVENLVGVLKSYSDIPFDGVGLDEYTGLRVSTTWELEKAKEVFRERPYSLAMDSLFKKETGLDLGKTLFDMAYTSEGNPEVRMKAINYYMGTLRRATMAVEDAVYKYGKMYFGPKTFIGLHKTHHNTLDGDEIWQTGLNWWTVKRDYGQTDESTPTCTQMGIGFSYPQNVLYNMYYSKSIDNISKKASGDLLYGIRTHYHAINDVQHWGVSVEQSDALEKINPVENKARLLNRFNPPFPKTDLLVVFGMEALLNWFPYEKNRGITDISQNLMIEQKAVQMWNAGYLNALVPSDLINNGSIRINKEGKPVLSGHTFEAIVFLYPEYSHTKTLQFLKDFVAKGGKLMVEGKATHDYDGHDVEKSWNEIASLATVKSFDIEKLDKLGLKKRSYQNGVINEDGSVTFDGIENAFDFQLGGHQFRVLGCGLFAMKANNSGQPEKIVATSLNSLIRDEKTILSLSKPSDISIENTNGTIGITIADPTKTVTVKAEF